MARNPDGLGRKPHEWQGRWRSYITVGYKVDGTPDRFYIYGNSEAECLRKHLDALRRIADGQEAKLPPDTLGAYLEEWLEQKALEVKPRTLAIYRGFLQPIASLLGRKQLAKLTPRDVQNAMRHIVGSQRSFTTYRAKRPRTVTLTAKSANAARATLANALEDAVNLGLLQANPVSRVKPLREEAAPVTVWTAAEVMRFTTTTRAAAADYHALFYLALTAGLRAGELIALEWGDVNGDTLTVRRTASAGRAVGSTKTAAGTRTIPLSPDTVETLEAHREGLRQAGLLASLVFPTATGSLLYHSNLRRSLHAWADRAGVPRIRPHDLRHTYASMAINSGMDVAELARRLGHTNPGFTLRQYVHFFEAAAARRAPSLLELTGHADRAGVIAGGTSAEGTPN